MVRLRGYEVFIALQLVTSLTVLAVAYARASWAGDTLNASLFAGYARFILLAGLFAASLCVVERVR